MEKIDLQAAFEPIHGDIEFIRIFMRFEYAVKKKYGTKKWTDLHKDLGQRFFELVVQKGLAKTIISHPPHKETYPDRVLTWVPSNRPKNTTNLLDLVNNVRNNLFHGGKSGHPDDDRNAQLISESIMVLLEALAQDEELRLHFERKD